MKKQIGNFFRGVRDYLIGNEKELKYSPLNVGDRSDPGWSDFFKNIFPAILEFDTVAIIANGVYAAYHINMHKAIGYDIIPLVLCNLAVIADIYSRSVGEHKVGNTGYGLIGRLRDHFGKKHEKKPETQSEQMTGKIEKIVSAK